MNVRGQMFLLFREHLLCQIILKSMHKKRSFYKLQSLLSNPIVYLQCLFRLVLIYLNKILLQLNVKIMARTSSIYDHFII